MARSPASYLKRLLHLETVFPSDDSWGPVSLQAGNVLEFGVLESRTAYMLRVKAVSENESWDCWLRDGVAWRSVLPGGDGLDRFATMRCIEQRWDPDDKDSC